jgi:chromosome segregation ATPase
MNDKKSRALETIDLWKKDGKLRLYAYYYGFDATSCEAVDRILSAVAIAGKMYHGTDQWTDEQDGEPTPVAVIQAAADEAAAELNKLADEVAQLQRSLRIADEALRIKESLLEAYRARTPQAKLQAQLERRREFLEHEIRHGGEGGHLSARLSEVEHLIARLGLDKDGS